MIVNLKYNCNPYGNHKVATRKPLVDTRKRKEPTYYCRKSSNHKRREPEKREQRNYRTVRNSSQNGNTYGTIIGHTSPLRGDCPFSEVPCLANYCFIYFVHFEVFSGRRVSWLLHLDQKQKPQNDSSSLRNNKYL